jgi:diguanylate cyclase (GGDEF)-like protein
VQSAGNAENLDFLTGLRNRFYLSENKDEIEKKKNVGITYIDITHLKNTNKHHGRAAGDKLIKQVTDMLRSHYKNSTIFRMSGDEFVVITENCTKSDFLKLSEMGDDLFGSNKLAEIGYKFYETIDNLKDCIKQCENLMYKRKEDKNAAARAVTEVTPEVVSVSAL